MNDDSKRYRLLVGDLDCVKWFLDHGADPNIPGLRCSVLATEALQSIQTSGPVMDLLLSKGAKISTDALFKAMALGGEGGKPVMEYLIKHGVDVNKFDEKLGTPLQ